MSDVSAVVRRIHDRVQRGEVDLRIASDALGEGFDQDTIAKILKAALHNREQ